MCWLAKCTRASLRCVDRHPRPMVAFSLSLSLNHPRSVSMRREHPVPQSQQHAAEKKWLAIYECINKNEISLTSPIIRCVTFNLCLKCAISAFLRYGGSLFRDHLVAGAYFPIRCNYGVESAMAVNGYSSRTAAAEAYNKFENNNAQHTHNTRRIIVICKKAKRSRGVRVDGHKHCLCLSLGTLYDAVLCIFMLPMNFHCIHFVLYNTDFLFFAVTQTNCRVFFSPLSFSAVASSLICIPHTDFKANTISYILNENYNNIKNDYNL